MSVYDWAERECRIACKRENPNFDFNDDNAWDYGCSCYKSALKAYKSLCDDDHSGASFGFTKNILIRLMEGQPLTPITDEDFFSVERGTEDYPLESPEFLKENGLKSDLQCPRMFGLFRKETLDGKVSYHDNDRAYYINVEDPSETYSSWCGFLDEMFPITMPYVPEKNKYKIYAQTFLVDRKHGDFDTTGILYLITPSGDKVDVGIYKTEDDNGHWVDITKEEYEKLLGKRLDKVSQKTADMLLWTLVSNSSFDEENARREEIWKSLSTEQTADVYDNLVKLCECFDKEEFWQYNKFSVRHNLCEGYTEKYKDIPELTAIADYLKNIILTFFN